MAGGMAMRHMMILLARDMILDTYLRKYQVIYTELD